MIKNSCENFCFLSSIVHEILLFKPSQISASKNLLTMSEWAVKKMLREAKKVSSTSEMVEQKPYDLLKMCKFSL